MPTYKKLNAITLIIHRKFGIFITFQVKKLKLILKKMFVLLKIIKALFLTVE